MTYSFIKKSLVFWDFFRILYLYKNKEMDEITKLKSALIQIKRELDATKKELEVVKEYLRKQHLLKSKTK